MPYSLPVGYTGTLLHHFDCTEEYTKDRFFKNPGFHVVSSPLGNYLEGAGVPFERFGYRFPIAHIGKPHMMIMRYPDDKRRHMLINDGFSYDLSTGVCTGAEYPVSGKVKELHYLFYTRTEDLTLTVMTWGEEEPAALFGVSIYELDELSEEKPLSGGRHIGIQYEDPNGILSDLGALTPDEWLDRLLCYARHTGQNRLVQPINWYYGPNFDSKTNKGGPTYWISLPDHSQYMFVSTEADNWFDRFLDKCQKAGVELIGSLTLLRLSSLMEQMNLDLPSIYAGKDTVNNMRADNHVQTSCGDWTKDYDPLNYHKMIDEGMPVYDPEHFQHVYGENDSSGLIGLPIFNPLHPTVRREVLRYVDEIARRFGTHPAFGGISVNVWHATFLWFGSLQSGYDDYTFSLFEKETGIPVSASVGDPTSPDRFNRRFLYVMGHCRKAFVQWRCEKCADFIAAIAETLQRADPKLMLHLTFWNEPVRKYMKGAIDEALQYPTCENEAEFLRDGGMDLSLLNKLPGVSIAVEENQHRDRGWSTQGVHLPITEQSYFHDFSYLDDSWQTAVKTSEDGGAFIFDSWEEAWGEHIYLPFNQGTPMIDEEIVRLGIKDPVFVQDTCFLADDGYWFDSQRQISTAYPADENYLEPFAHAVASCDPLYITRGGLYLDKLHASHIRQYTAAYTPIPAKKFDDIPGGNDPVAVRAIYENGKTYWYAVNREPYELCVKLSFGTHTAWHEFSLEKEDGKGEEQTIILRPFGIRSFVSDGKSLPKGFCVTVPQEETAKLKAAYERMEKDFRTADEKGVALFGSDLVRKELAKAFKNGSVSRVRHLLKCYVCRRTRQLVGDTPDALV